MTAHYVVTCTDCGHRGVYQTQQLADFHFPRHSCELVVERRARAARRLTGLAAAGETRHCTHPAQHQHGSYVAYTLDRCRCLPCKEANRNYERDRVRAALYGKSRLVDAQPARDHVQQLQSGGMGMKTIAAAAGVHHSVVITLIYGRTSKDPSERRPPRKQISRDLAAKILAVNLDLAPAAIADGTGSARRIQALVAVGWSMSKIADAVGISRANFTPIAHRRRNVQQRTADKVAAVYEQLWDEKPPIAKHRDLIAYRRSLRFAADRGWPPPAAWDDDDIDEPTAKPHLAATKYTNRKVDLDDVQWLCDTGSTLAEIENRLNIAPKSLQKILARRSPELWTRIRDAEETRRTRPRRVA